MTCCTNGKPGSSIPIYDKPVFIEKPPVASDANGQNDQSDNSTWTAAWSTRARFVTSTSTNVTTATGLEVEVGNQKFALNPVALYVPYSSDARVPKLSHRVRLGSGAAARYFNIIYAERVNLNGNEVLIKAIEQKQPA